MLYSKILEPMMKSISQSDFGTLVKMIFGATQ